MNETIKQYIEELESAYEQDKRQEKNLEQEFMKVLLKT